jgi:hypothetical protein
MLPACIAHCLAFWLCLITSSFATPAHGTSARQRAALDVYANFVAIFSSIKNSKSFLRPSLSNYYIPAFRKTKRVT